MAQDSILVVFDIDGTLAKIGPDDGADIYDEARLAALPPWDNVVAIAQRYMKDPKVVMMFCSGRPKGTYRVTWDWLNRLVGLSRGKSVTLALRPEEVSEDRIAPYKLSEIVQAIRRLGSKPNEAIVFDDDVTNLQMFEVVRPTVRRLRLYRAEDGIVSQWGES